MTYILYNPKANNGNGAQGLDKVAAAEKAELLDLTAIDTAAFLSSLPAEDTAIVCGGDGTLHRLVNDLDGVEVKASLYVRRTGTGNDFLRDVGVTKPGGMVRLNEYIENLPYAQIGGKTIRFLNNVCFGIDGQVCELGEQEKERLGRKVSYPLLAIRLALRDYHLTSATVTVDGVTKHYDKVWLASALNGRYVGGGMKLAPGQDRTSGELCCVILRGTGRLYLLSRLASVYWGGHVKLPCCEMVYGNEIEVTFDAPTAMNLDGEVVPRVTGFRAVKEPITEKAASLV